MLSDPKIWGTHLKRREVVMIVVKIKFNSDTRNLKTARLMDNKHEYGLTK